MNLDPKLIALLDAERALCAQSMIARSPVTRADALETLKQQTAHIDKRSAINAFVHGLSDRDYICRRIAARALGKHGNEHQVFALRLAMNRETESETCATMATALQAIYNAVASRIAAEMVAGMLTRKDAKTSVLAPFTNEILEAVL